MRCADRWHDYRLVDCTCSEKLEYWGKVSLVRPDPQVIWKTAKKTPVWDKADGHYHRSEKGGGQWSFTRRLPESWQIGYDLITGQKLTFNIRPTGFKHTGTFSPSRLSTGTLWQR